MAENRISFHNPIAQGHARVVYGDAFNGDVTNNYHHHHYYDPDASRTSRGIMSSSKPACSRDLQHSAQRYQCSILEFRYRADDEAAPMVEKVEGRSRADNHVAAARELQSSRSTYQIPFSLQHVPTTKDFIDRPAEMKAIEDALLPSSQMPRRMLFVLRGLGGIGKTQLAVEFARRHHEDFDAIFWLDGRTVDSLKRSFEYHAERLPPHHLPEIDANVPGLLVHEMLKWLAKKDNTRWLLIFDNVDRDPRDPKVDPLAYDIKRYIPTSDHGSILITTRLVKLQQLGHSQEIRKLDDDAARNLFVSWYPEVCDEIDIQQLMELLDGLPLAIAQAGAYLQESGINVKTYVSLYRKSWKRLAETLDHDPLEGYGDRSVLTTWNISYDLIRRKDRHVANLLLFWSFLDNDDFRHGLFRGVHCCAPTAASVTHWLGNIWEDELNFIEAMRLLRSYSVIQDNSSQGSYSVHSVVHQWARHHQDEETRLSLARLAIIVVGHAAPIIDHRDTSELNRRVLPHVEKCTSGLLHGDTDVIADIPKLVDQASLVHSEELELLKSISSAGTLFSTQRRLREAEQLLGLALHLEKEALGPEHRITLDTTLNIGLLYKQQNKLDEAEKMFMRALDGYERVHGSAHELTVTAIYHLGMLYWRQYKMGRSEEMLLRALERHEEAVGSNDLLKLDMFSALADIYTRTDRLKQAEELYDQALRGYEETLGPAHETTLAALRDMADLYGDQDRLTEAQPLYDRALKGSQEMLGPTHPTTISTMTALGLLYTKRGKLNDAKVLLEQAVRLSEQSLGLSHVSTLDTVNSLGNLYIAQGDVNAAGRIYMRALRGYEDSYGADHPSTLMAVSNMGAIYITQGKFKEAEDMCQRAIEGRKRVLGPKHTSTLETICLLANLYTRQDKMTEAEKFYNEVLHGYEEALGARHSSTLAAMKNLSILYRKQARLEEAEEMFLKILQISEEAHGDASLLTLDAVGSVGLIYSDRDKVTEALKMYMRALRGYDSALGPEFAETYPPALQVMRNLGIFLVGHNRQIEAKFVLRRALLGYTNLRGPSSAVCQDLSDRLAAIDIQVEREQHQEKGTGESGNP